MRRVATALAAAACAGSMWLSTGAQGLVPAPGSRILISEVTAPPIDRGLRENDLPREPRTQATDVRARVRGDAFVPGSLIVRFRPGTGITARRAMLSLVNGGSVTTPPYADFELIALTQGVDAETAARQLEAQPDVEYAQARYLVHPLFVPNDPLYSRQWNYPAIDMERAWDLNRGATSSTIVAVLDTGLAYRNAVFRYRAPAWQIGATVFPDLGLIDVPFAAAPELGGSDRFVAPRDLIWDDGNPVDLDGHGTHVAGTIGQLTNNGIGVAGMAFGVRLMPVKVVAGDWDFVFGSPFDGTDDVVARGIRYAVDNGARVLNMSIGRTGPEAPAIHSALTYAVSKGAFVVVSAGNGFEEGNKVERLAEFAPQIDGMVSVGAIGRDRRRAFYSTTGPYVELVAPGGNANVGGSEGTVLQQTYDLDLVETFLRGPSRYRAPRFDAFTYQYFQGTSMAAPHVAGFAALLMQQGITSPTAIEAAMKRTATDLGASGRDDEFGHGLINPRAALRGLGLVR